jgi:hypothetical protein
VSYVADELRRLGLEVKLEEVTAPATFTELRIAVRVEDTLAPQAPSVLGAFPHDLAALYHDWPPGF